MLNAKNGVITEDRFQNMTLVQWLFHYHEVHKFKSEKREYEFEIVEAILKLLNSSTSNIIETVLDAAKLTGAMANPEAGKALLDAEKLREAKADIGDDEFCDWWEEFSSRIPGQLIVENEGEHVDLEGDGINLEKLYEIEMDARKKEFENN